MYTEQFTLKKPDEIKNVHEVTFKNIKKVYKRVQKGL